MELIQHSGREPDLMGEVDHTMGFYLYLYLDEQDQGSGLNLKSDLNAVFMQVNFN